MDINTQSINKESGSQGEKTAKVAGGTAAVGAIIGAIAGGGKGAAIGAGAGAAAGAGSQVMLRRPARAHSVGNAAHLRPRQPDQFLMKQPTAIVTGGSRGIGRAIATELAKTHRVIATYRGRKDAADSLREETGCEIFQCEIGSRDDRAALLAFARAAF